MNKELDIPEWMLPTTVRPALNHPDREHEREWKDQIILRDQNSCRMCGKYGDMDVHHVTYEHWGCEEPDDGVCLCRDPCHARVTDEQRRRRMQKSGKEKARNNH